MSQELHYTSVPRGLKPGSRGFGTVAVTANLPGPLAERLESLSGYQAVYPPGDPSAALNPVAYAHVRLTMGGEMLNVLSRIGPAGLDYSGRPNKYALHVVLDAGERPEGGPAWLLSQPGFLQAAWDGEPRVLPEGRRVPRGDRPAGIAADWAVVVGDAGWAGALAESFLADPRRPVFLVYRPGMELLPLFVEAIALLPPPRRWDVEFSTYFSTLPQGITCIWRGVLDGSAEAESARRLPQVRLIDLCRPAARARGGALVHLARTGERRNPSSEDTITTSPRKASRGPSATADRLALNGGPPITAARPGSNAGYDLFPDLTTGTAAPLSLRSDEGHGRPRRATKTRIAIIAASCLIPLVAAGLYWSPDGRKRLEFEPDRSRPIIEGGSGVSRIEENAPAGPAAGPETKTGKIVVVGKEPDEKAHPEHRPSPDAGKTSPAAGKPTAEAKPGPAAPAPLSTDKTGPSQPLIRTIALPEIRQSGLGSPIPRQREFQLPEDVNDRFEILNAPEFRQTAAAAASTWEIATKTGSGLGGGFPLARLSRTDVRTWRFDWAKEAKNHSTLVDSLRDAVLKFETRDGRSIFALLRGLDLRNDDRPLVVWDNQRLLFDRLEPRMRSVDWTPNPDVLSGTRWKLGIRRWKVVISHPDADDPKPPLIVKPAPIAGEMEPDGIGRVKLEGDLIQDEILLKLAIQPAEPGTITVRIDPDRDKIRERRADRASRLKELKKATPPDPEDRERDPIDYRRGRLRKLKESGEESADEVQSVKREIRELEEINQIQQVEDRLSRPARVELSVVIGLNVGGSRILDIAAIGNCAD
jgi:hypothetical protein